MGGRSAVLAPMPKVDLIIVDDEAHPALREGRAPRYDTVRAATLRAKRDGGKVIAVGVPPSLERRLGAHPKAGSWTLVREPGRSPRVRVIEPGTLVPEGPTVTNLKDASGRILVLLHRSEIAERVAERMARVLSRDAQVVDASSDREVLAAARRPDGPSIVVASPVVAEDHHIDGVSDLVILEADAALSDPGYRTGEQVFGTWWRVLHACRPGRVLIESSLRDHIAVQALAAADPDVLTRHEAKMRDSLGYPPYRTLVRIDVPSEASSRLEADLGDLPDRTEVVGPLTGGDGSLAYLVRGDRETLTLLRPVVSAWSRDGIPARIEVDPLDILERRWQS
jgi:primosomal protein N'